MIYFGKIDTSMEHYKSTGFQDQKKKKKKAKNILKKF